jgi:Flp pilus assembly protein TadG
MNTGRADWSAVKTTLGCRQERGAALVELAVALPILAVLLVGAIDFARVLRATMVITQAARAGAMFGAQKSVNAGNTSGMVAAANAVLTANGLSSGPSPTASRLCQCATDSGVFSPTSPANTCTATACTSSHLTVSVTVSVTRDFSVATSLPGIPRAMTLTRTVTQRSPN